MPTRANTLPSGSVASISHTPRAQVRPAVVAASSASTNWLRATSTRICPALPSAWVELNSSRTVPPTRSRTVALALQPVRSAGWLSTSTPPLLYAFQPSATSPLNSMVSASTTLANRLGAGRSAWPSAALRRSSALTVFSSCGDLTSHTWTGQPSGMPCAATVRRTGAALGMAEIGR
ncbi:hypothetical protein D3C78_1441020 [compost metagenome]